MGDGFGKGMGWAGMDERCRMHERGWEEYGWRDGENVEKKVFWETRVWEAVYDPGENGRSILGKIECGCFRRVCCAEHACVVCSLSGAVRRALRDDAVTCVVIGGRRKIGVGEARCAGMGLCGCCGC